jgi:YjbE family integral membrane protein
MEFEALAVVPAIVEIAFIDLILSGDNAVVIALATRSLPPGSRQIGVLFGIGASLLLRILATGMVGLLLTTPYLKLVAAAALVYVAIKLMLPDDDSGDPDLAAEGNLWVAVRLIAIADITMSLDNVLAVASAANGSLTLLVFGLLLSVPLLVYGSQIVSKVIDRLPVLVPLCGGLLGWIAGGIAVTDPAIVAFIEAEAPAFIVVAPLSGAVFVMLASRILGKRMLDRSRVAQEFVA